MSSTVEKTVLILGTLDTKSAEVKYLRKRITEAGLKVMIIDNGVLGEPDGIEPDFSNYDTAKAAGTTLEMVRRCHGRGAGLRKR